MKEYWVCIIGPVDEKDFPKEVNGFDSVPRTAAIEAIEKHDIEVKDCWSGWGSSQKRMEEIMYVWNKIESKEVK